MNVKEFVGLTLEDAKTLAESKEMKFRITSKDGVPFIGTCDFWINRVNVGIVDNKVIHATLG